MGERLPRASGIGSMPGGRSREALVTVRDLLLDADGLGLPYLPELPGRGPGADIIGRAAGLLVGLTVDLQLGRWRLVDRPGRDAERTASLWREDLDEAAAAYADYSGDLKLQVCGPWTLAASLLLSRGEPVLSDPGAVRDLLASYTEGVGEHLEAVSRLIPGARFVLQLDEPSLPAVLEGGLRTASGLNRLAVVDPSIAAQGLRSVLAVHDGPTVVHCCHDRIPLPLLRTVGAGAIALDVRAATPARWEGLAVALEAGLGIYAGILAADGSDSAQDAADRLCEGLDRAGMPLRWLREFTVTPACGLAGASAGDAVAAHRTALETARELSERIP